MITETLTRLKRLRYRVKSLSWEAGWRPGRHDLSFTDCKGARMLVYHGICRHHPLRYNTLFIKLSRFEEQLKLYKQYFNLISLDDFYNNRFASDRFNLCLTFDDGFANNYKYVLPLLEQYQVPAAFFVTGIRDAGYDILWNDVLAIAYKHGPRRFVFNNETFIRNQEGKYVASNNRYLSDILRGGDFTMKAGMIQAFEEFKHNVDEDYWLQLSIPQIAELACSRWVTIGSHGYYHNDLAAITPAAAESEMIKTRIFLEHVTGKEITALAFPYGSYSKDSVEMAKQCGYSQVLATDFLFPGDAADNALRERLTINPFISGINQMHANISGTYQ